MKRSEGEPKGEHSAPLAQEVERPSVEAELFAVEHGADTVEVDLHGMDSWDARQECERAIDAAFYAGDRGVRIVHGIGSGALRTLVRKQILRSHPLVESWRPADFPHAASTVIVLIRHRT